VGNPNPKEATMTMNPNDGHCSDGACKRLAQVMIRFFDGKRLPYCAQCSKKIGGQQTTITHDV
jgi:hypothetical protein